AGILRKGLSQVVFAAATSDSRPVLTGVYLHTEEGRLFMVATDSSRLAEKEIGATKKEIKLLVPATSMHELQRVLDEHIEIVNVVMDEQQAMFKVGDTELVSRLINSNYPSYRAIIPKEQAINAVVKRSDLLNITKVSSLFARETAGSITIEVDEDQKNIHIRALASQLGENSSMADAKVTGSGSVTLNSKFLIDALNAMSGEDVEFSFNSKIEPVLIKDPKNKDYIHVIMPLKA
ncbi:DNA polymerase III subunit beta, partial [bacterium]|nr:DNA polymerase III subunit beta [bacterium]